ncbi:MAG: hypothetical protein HY392_01580 [Candidatus Diapherotrites archaeon]|nr:hypothetical protein [Candidatus Diapherotrites archaeon]
MPDLLQAVLNNIIQQNRQLIFSLKEKRKAAILPLFINPLNRAIVDEVYDIMESDQVLTKDLEKYKNLDIVLDSHGGDPDAAFHIGKYLHEKVDGKITFIIPRFAKSAATLLVCAGDEIIMGPTSELGPLDPQIRQPGGTYISVKSIQNLFELIKSREIKKDALEAIFKEFSPLILGEYDSYLKISKDYQKQLLELRMKKNLKMSSEKICNHFTEEYTHHSRPILAREASEYLNVKIMDEKEEEWKTIWELYTSHKQILYLVRVQMELQKASDLKRISE